MPAYMPQPGRMAREPSKQRGCVSGTTPLPLAAVKIGTPVASMKRVSSSPASEYQAPLPAISIGFSDSAISASSSRALSRSTTPDSARVTGNSTSRVGSAPRTSTGSSR